MNVKPLGDRVLVQPIEARRSEEGRDHHSRIPPRKNHRKARSSPSGTGKRDDDGKLIPFEVKKGDRVLISKYGGTEIKIDGKEYLIMREDDILGVIE